MISRRLGGASALSWPAFWVCLVTSIAGNLTDRFTVQSGFNIVLNLAANVVAVAAMFAVMLALRPLLLRDAAVTPRPGRAIVMFVIGAATRGVVLGLLLGLMGTGEPRLLFRVIASVVTLTLAMAICATIVDLVRTGQARRRALRAEAEGLQRAEDEALAKATGIQERATAQVRSLLLDRLTTLQGGEADDLAPGLRADADEVIRPMSHEMVALPAPAPRVDERPDVGRIRWGDVWSAASLGQPFRPFWGAVLLMVMSLSMLTAYNASLPRGLAYAVIGGLLIAGVLVVLGRVVTPRLRTMGPRARTATLIASMIGALVAAAIPWGLIMDAAGSDDAWRSPISIVIGGLVVTLGLAIEQGFRRQAEGADAELVAANARLKYAAAVAGAAAWHEERRVSRALHGPVQTAVRAAAMRIDQGDLAGAERLLVDALGHLEPDPQRTGVRDALTGVAKAWDGLCAVDVELTDELATRIDDDPPLASSVVDICTDACSNAVRHGGATNVAMRAQPTGDALELVVSDDGAPDATAGTPGMGSAILDDVSIEWLRRREGERTVLRATLPLG
ncbi:MAG: hypothetical protein FJW99_06985 [Actinobacteria bacterium]|nr:hypothetical protein [Actinomycetota bacterium]